jgi:hypothetical protein
MSNSQFLRNQRVRQVRLPFVPITKRNISVVGWRRKRHSFESAFSTAAPMNSIPGFPLEYFGSIWELFTAHNNKVPRIWCYYNTKNKYAHFFRQKCDGLRWINTAFQRHTHNYKPLQNFSKFAPSWYQGLWWCHMKNECWSGNHIIVPDEFYMHYKKWNIKSFSALLGYTLNVRHFKGVLKLSSPCIF